MDLLEIVVMKARRNTIYLLVFILRLSCNITHEEINFNT